MSSSHTANTFLLNKTQTSAATPPPRSAQSTTSSSSRTTATQTKQGAGSLDIISCGIGPERPWLSLCQQAESIFAAQSLLPSETTATCYPLSKNIQQDVDHALRLARQGQRVLILASGDALYHGLGAVVAKTLQKHARLHGKGEKDSLDYAQLGFHVCFHPNVTAFQVLCHRLGLAWSQAKLFSAHHSEPDCRQILAAPLAIVYSGFPYTGTKLVQALLEFDPLSATRRCVMASQLGQEHETILQCTLQDAAKHEWPATSILILLPQGQHQQTLPLGLSDSHYRFDGHCLTSSKLRPLVLASLELPLQGVFWDLGAGSGSIGLEASLLCPELNVWAVEQEAQRCENIRYNAAKLGAVRYNLVPGKILDVLAQLPRPNRIFVGGGGHELATIIPLALQALDPTDEKAKVVATAISLESIQTLMHIPCGELSDLCSIDIATQRSLGRHHYLAPQNRIHLFTFTPKQGRTGC